MILRMAQLFGVFVTHSPESCPLNNKESNKTFVEIEGKLRSDSLAKYGIAKIVGFYLSVLEHEWVIILDAESAHGVETFCIEVGISKFNTVKIVPLNNFEAVMSRIRRTETA